MSDIQESLFDDAQDQVLDNVLPDHVRYELISDKVHYEWLKDYLENSREKFQFIGMDTETDGLSYVSCNLVGMSLSVEPGFAFYIPVRHKVGQNLPFDLYIELLNLIKNLRYETVWFNAGFDWHFITKDLGHDDFPFDHDTQLQLKLLNSNSKFPSLKTTVKEVFGVKMIDFMDNFRGKQRSEANFADVPPVQAVKYAAADADYTLQLHHKFGPHVSDRIQKQIEIYLLEMALVPALCRQERKGVILDMVALSEVQKRVESLLKEMGKTFLEMAGIKGHTPSQILNSPQKLSNLFFDKLKIPYPFPRAVRNKMGVFPCDKKVLEKLESQFPVVSVASKWKRLSTFASRTLTSLPASISSDGRLHTRYNSFDADTGRLSSSSVWRDRHEGTNLQQISKSVEGESSEEAFNARTAFVADPGYYFLDVDYSQIEYRILAGLAGETSIIEGFASGQDYHTLTASLVFGVPVDKVTKEQRQKAKAVNFGQNYGQESYGLSFNLNISVEQAEEIMALYWAGLPNIKRYKQEQVALARKSEQTTTLFGRIRDLRDDRGGINDGPNNIRKFWERSVSSHQVQGTAADIMKQTIVRVDKACRSVEGRKLGIVSIMNIHDELLFLVPNEVSPKEAASFICPVMTMEIKGWPLLTVEPEYGPTWGDLKVVDGYESVKSSVVVEWTDAPLPEDTTEGSQSLPYGSLDLGLCGQKVMVVQTESDDVSKFKTLRMLCEASPGDYNLVVRRGDLIFKSSLKVTPALSLVKYVTDTLFMRRDAVLLFDEEGRSQALPFEGLKVDFPKSFLEIDGTKPPRMDFDMHIDYNAFQGVDILDPDLQSLV